MVSLVFLCYGKIALATTSMSKDSALSLVFRVEFEMSHLQVSQLISCMERVTDAMAAEEELCWAHKERYHVSFSDARVFSNSSLVLGWILSQIFPLKNGLSANCVCPPKAGVLCSAVSSNTGKKPGSPQPASSAQSVGQGKFHKYQRVWVKTVCTETYLRFQMF